MNRSAPAESFGSLERALAERDRRTRETERLLASGRRSVVRLSARMPASLRERGLADEPVRNGGLAFEALCRAQGLDLRPAGSGAGALGPWRLWVSGEAALDLKRAAVSVEEASWLGRLLDLDVMTREGPVGRSSLGLAPRPCVICGTPAAVCSGRAVHPSGAVEAAFFALLRRYQGAIEQGSPGGLAVGAVQP